MRNGGKIDNPKIREKNHGRDRRERGTQSRKGMLAQVKKKAPTKQKEDGGDGRGKNEKKARKQGEPGGEQEPMLSANLGERSVHPGNKPAKQEEQTS